MCIDEFSNFMNKLGCEFCLNEPLSRHSSFKIGGLADVFIKPYDIMQLKSVLEFCREKDVPYVVVGNGSNILFKDEGFKGAVINIGPNMASVKLEDENIIVASAGVPLAKVAYFAMEHSLAGFEFVWGIPGNIGGAVFMNAGAYDGEIKDIIVSSNYIDRNNNEGVILKEDMGLGYRKSVYMENGFIITGAKFKLKKGNKTEIKTKMDEFMQRRKSKQPLEYPNVGSIFKRPQGNFAGTLIEKCGLKGKSIGGAMVSEKHAGFIVNTGSATAKDVIALIDFVRNEVFKQTGYDLEPEVRIY